MANEKLKQLALEYQEASEQAIAARAAATEAENKVSTINKKICSELEGTYLLGGSREQYITAKKIDEIVDLLLDKELENASHL